MTQQHSNVHVSKWHEDIPSVLTAAGSPILVTVRLLQELNDDRLQLLRKNTAPEEAYHRKLNPSPQRTAPWATQWQSVIHKESLSKCLHLLAWILLHRTHHQSHPGGDSWQRSTCLCLHQYPIRVKEMRPQVTRKPSATHKLGPKLGSLGFHQCSLNVSLGSNKHCPGRRSQESAHS